MKSKERFKLLKRDHITVNGRILYRIKALVDINDDVKKGDLGGYIEKKYNLDPHEGTSWVYPGSKVYGYSYITGCTKVVNSTVFISSIDAENTIRNATIVNSVIIDSLVNVNKPSKCYIYESELSNCVIDIDSIMTDGSHILKENIAVVMSTIKNCYMYSSNLFSTNTLIYSSHLYDKDIPADSCILGTGDIISFSGFGCEYRNTSISLNRKDEIIVECGCFRGNIDEFEEKINKSYEDYWENEERHRCFNEYLQIANAARYHFCEISNVMQFRNEHRKRIHNIGCTIKGELYELDLLDYIKKGE